MSPRIALLALMAFILLSILFRTVPGIDLWASSVLYDPADLAAHGRHPWLLNLRQMARWLMIGTIVVLLGAVLLKLVRPERPLVVPGRAIVFLVGTLILGPLLTVNVGLKDHWGRPRPNEISAFGGPSTMVPAWRLDDQCLRNCSFVSGEVAATTWLAGIAMVAPPPARLPLAAGTAILVTAVAGMRMAFGGHFLSDVVLSALLTWLILWVAHWLLYRLDPPWLRSARIDCVLGCTARRLRTWVRQGVGAIRKGWRARSLRL